jgi:hypothetical protein
MMQTVEELAADGEAPPQLPQPGVVSMVIDDETETAE